MHVHSLPFMFWIYLAYHNISLIFPCYEMTIYEDMWQLLYINVIQVKFSNVT